jgi:hypothetical protein
VQRAFAFYTTSYQHFSEQQAPGGMRDFQLAAALELGDALY